MEIGLTVPRPPVQLYGSLKNIKILGRDDTTIDITQAMDDYSRQRPPQLNSIHGYIFKSRSPSCGIKDIAIFNSSGEVVDTTKGIFVSAILQHYPQLPITDEQSLQNPAQYAQFFQRVKRYQQK